LRDLQLKNANFDDFIEFLERLGLQNAIFGVFEIHKMRVFGYLIEILWIFQCLW
jgi:hypothetical protein